MAQAGVVRVARVEKYRSAFARPPSRAATPWTTSPIEGQISRLKMIKRTMFGRAWLSASQGSCPPDRIIKNIITKSAEEPRFDPCLHTPWQHLLGG
ncbi:hypothetical protein APA386B_1P73 (plasmid) [Acetobacter pasteurianus 386B]|nr:hypothetical protein APA386B_1P73 [Acetobacter pasteurianus 386B]